MSGLADWNDEHGHLFVLGMFNIPVCWWCGKRPGRRPRKCRGTV